MSTTMIRLGVAFLLLALTACNDGKPAPLQLGREVTVTGRMSYEFIPAITTDGFDAVLDVDNAFMAPASGSTVEVVLDNGSIYTQTSVADDGTYSIPAPVEETVLIRLVAETRENGGPQVQVIRGEGVAAVGRNLETGSVEDAVLTVDIEVASGWTTSGASADRMGGAFAILDVIDHLRKTVRSASSTVTFPFLQIDWSDSADGSFFSPATNVITIARNAAIDSDEYDYAVVAHEWVHYFAAANSQDDSVGGRHSLDDILDDSVAYSEGLATGLALAILDSPIYYDTKDNGQTGSLYEIEFDQAGDALTVATDGLSATEIQSDGAYNQYSISQVIWDLYDDVDDDVDQVSLGIAPLITALLDPATAKPTEFSSIFQFAAALRAANPADASGIDTILIGENIAGATATAFEDPDSILGPRYTELKLGEIQVDAGDRGLQTWDSFNASGIDWQQEAGNKLYNFQKFRGVLPAGNYVVTISNSSQTFLLIKNPGSDDLLTATDDEGQPIAEAFLNLTSDGTTPTVFAISSYQGEAAFSMNIVEAGNGDG